MAKEWIRKRLTFLVAIGSLGLLAPIAVHAAATPCGDLLRSGLPKTQIIIASDVEGDLPATDQAGAAQHGPAAKTEIQNLPRFCRVMAVLAPVEGSHIGIELWMPEHWNGKLLGLGNHGFAGEYERGYMAMGVERGYAVVTTDTGHSNRTSDTQAGFQNGRIVSSGFNIGNASFATGNPVAVEDFAWRAIHEMTVAAKALVLKHYGVGAHRAYFDGCSTGGRQAMREVQQFPDDYNGAIAGGAPMDWTRVMASGLSYYLSGSLPSGARMTQAKLNLAQKAAIAACDAQDGATDGLIADPSRCRWDPKSIVCRAGEDQANCLTADEASAIERVETELKNPRTGESLYPPLAPGSEGFWLLMMGFNPVASNHFRYLVQNDPAWAPNASTDLWELLQRSEQPGAPASMVRDTSPDLSSFRKRGGKLIQYHGWNDQAMAPGFYTKFYAAVIDLQPGRDKLVETQSFYRLFMVPGMTHCSGGMGPVNFGALNHIASPVRDADHDVLEALDRWVDKGVAPEKIIATQFSPDQKVERQMPLCPWPKVATYTKGDVSLPDSFECRAPGPESAQKRPPSSG